MLSSSLLLLLKISRENSTQATFVLTIDLRCAPVYTAVSLLHYKAAADTLRQYIHTSNQVVCHQWQ